MSAAGKTRRICLWSGPRNVSTALMYSFAQRPDAVVVDEPLYAHYLAVSGARHPGREEVLASQDNDGNAVMQALAKDPVERPVLFAKQMAHHLVAIDLTWLGYFDNVLLIRDPVEMLPSLAEVLPEVTLRDTGLESQARLIERLEAAGGRPFCIDARLLLLDPAGVLRAVCERLGLSFYSSMLSWPLGPRPEDGVWARYWYASVHRSSGFRPWRPSNRDMPPALERLYQACRPFYEFLLERAVGAQGADRAD